MGLGVILSAATFTMAEDRLMQDRQSWVEALHVHPLMPTSHGNTTEHAVPSQTDATTGYVTMLQEERIVPVRIHSITATEPPGDAVESFAVMGDIYTDIDHTEYGEEILAVLDQVKQIVRYAEGSTVQLEAHCDDRQSSAYSLIIGEQRARSLATVLQTTAVEAARIGVVSYGLERPGCRQWTINCWEDNLRMQRVFRTVAFIEPHDGCFVRITILDGEEIVRYLQKSQASALLKKIHFAETPGPLSGRSHRLHTH